MGYNKDLHDFLQVDNSDLVRLAMYHMEANPDRSQRIGDIDILIEIARKFNDKHYKRNWEEYETDWESALAEHYNANRPREWDGIKMA